MKRIFIFSCNENNLEIIKNNKNKIDWDYLSLNKNAIDLLKENQHKIHWNNFSKNTAIFTYDYEKIRYKNQDLNYEIICKALHPKRMLRLINEYSEDIIYNCYFEDE
jgi:hypothetical protein